MSDSRLVAFYRGQGRDGAGRTLDEILAWDDGPLEYHHDFIQWLFPLRERSGANPTAPVLGEADIRAFREEAVIQANLRRSLERMRAFYGLDGKAGLRPWLTPGNHNFLRLTRMLHCLRLVGLEAEAAALFQDLSGLYRDHAPLIEARTFGFWQRAAQGS